LDDEQKLAGVIPRTRLNKLLAAESDADAILHLEEAAIKNPVVAFPNEPLRNVVNRMAEVNLTRFPVVDEADPRLLLGIISLDHLLRARIRSLQEERTRERILRIRLPMNGRKDVKAD
jgi:CIC family chloride channel protein